MKRFAVGFISFFDNELKIQIVEADDWYSALTKAFPQDFNWPSSSLANAKTYAFDCDSMIEVTEIPPQSSDISKEQRS
jgi:hypothetical protein